MKKRIALLLAAAVILTAVLSLAALAGDDETLTVETGTSTYTLRKGEQFTYSYWVRLLPDIANYGEDYINNKLNLIGVPIPLGSLLQDYTEEMKLRSIAGRVEYDPDMLTLVGASIPNLLNATCQAGRNNDPDARLSGTVDFASGELERGEATIFQKTEILVTCTFEVKNTGTTCVHTKLDSFIGALPGLLIRELEKEVKMVEDGKVKVPYEAYETVQTQGGSEEKPSIVLQSLVADLCLNLTYGEEETPIPAGTPVMLYGLSSEGRWVNITQNANGGKELWFYDLPYGEYHVQSAFKLDGNNYAVPELALRSIINFPLDGNVFDVKYEREEPGETMQISVHMTWVRDNGYLPVRPEYIYARLIANGDENTPAGSRVIGRDIIDINFDNVAKCVNAVPIDYTIAISTISTDTIIPYDFAVKKMERADGSGIDFEIIATYVGDMNMLGEITTDEEGHFWTRVGTLGIEETCTTEGSAYYICEVCHRTKYVKTPPKGHVPVIDPAVEPTHLATGRTEGSHCAICNAVIVAQEVIPILDAMPAALDMTGVSSKETVAYADGVPCVIEDGVAMITKPNAKLLVMYSYNGLFDDIHLRYPTHMYVWRLNYDAVNETYTAARLTDFDDIMQYAGSSIRITGQKGVRMITTIPADKKKKLTSTAGLDGFVMEENGTIVAWDSDLGSDQLTIENPTIKRAYAYHAGEADPVFREYGNVSQFTNVLVGFTAVKCIPDLVMRPYMILREVSTGDLFPLYGGQVTRNIGYIAYQNRAAFAPENDAYSYIWSIIHYVYGTVYDDDYSKVK